MGPVLPVGARLTRRVREEPPPGELARVYSDRSATMSGAKATRFSRDGSPAEPPPGELGRVGFITGCSAGMDRRPSPHRENWAARVSLQAVQPGWIAGRAPTGRTGPRGFHHRLFGRDGSPVEPHRENWAAWVLPQAVSLGRLLGSASRPRRAGAGARRAGSRVRLRSPLAAAPLPATGTRQSGRNGHR